MDGDVRKPGHPTPKQQSWGALLSIVVIMLMVVVGAAYAWQKHAAEERTLQGLSQAPAAAPATTTP